MANVGGRPVKETKQSCVITFQTTPEFRKELERHAEFDERPLSQWIRIALKSYMKSKILDV